MNPRPEGLGLHGQSGLHGPSGPGQLHQPARKRCGDVDGVLQVFQAHWLVSGVRDRDRSATDEQRRQFFTGNARGVYGLR